MSPIGTHRASQVAEPTDSGEGREPDRLVLGTARSLTPEKAYLCTEERGEDVDQGDEATPSSTAGLAKEGLASRRRDDREETAGRHHRLDGHGFEQAPGVGDGQGGLACCSPRGCKESDTTE